MGLKFGAEITEAEEAEIAAMLDKMGDGFDEPNAPKSRRGKAPAPEFSDTPDDDAGEPELEEDPDPGYGRESIADRLFPDDDFDKPVRVTQALKKDVRGKLAMLLGITGAAWSNRDQICGGMLLQSIPDRVDDESGEQVPGLATAIADIVCDSPDMVKWFTTSGKYMKWITLALAAQPVLTVIAGHHVMHTITEEPQDERDYSGFGV